MTAPDPKTVQFIRQPAKQPVQRKAIALGDLALSARLLMSWPIAWLTPQSLWPAIARHTSSLGHRLARKTMNSVAKPMRRALADAGEAKIAGLADDLRSARYEVAFQCLRGYRPGGWRPKIAVQGSEHIDDALAFGKGCVLWVSHFVFAPNVVKVGLHELGYRVSHLSRPDHGFSSTRFGIRFLNRVRTKFEDRYLAERIRFDRAHPAAALLRARKTVNANGIISFTAGAWEGSSVVESRFLSNWITLAMGPVWLARASGAALLPVFATRTGAPDRFLVQIEGPIDVGAGATEAESLEKAAQSFLLSHELRVLKDPGQWRGWSALRDRPQAG